MKHYFFVMTQLHFYNGKFIGRRCGTLMAENPEEARRKAIELAGNEGTSLDMIEEFDPAEGFAYTVYRASFHRFDEE